MATGACGIHCDVCRLRVEGLCSTCGPGNSVEAQKKMAAQVSILGAPCPILECASSREVAHCLRDCDEFACGRFRGYPFSEGYLKMQERRRTQHRQALDPVKEKIQVPVAYWEALEKKDLATLCDDALARAYPREQIALSVLDREILLDRKNRVLRHRNRGEWEPLSHPLLELLILVYLLHVGPQPLSGELVSVQELKTAHFFQGPHELNIRGVLERFGRDPSGFVEAAASLGGKPEKMADAAYRIPALPKVPLYYLLWEGDEEFDPRLSVLFDRTVERHLSADAIWGLVALVSDALLKAPSFSF